MEDLYRKSGAEAYGISRARFDVLLADVCRRANSQGESLHLADLALAWGCALGSDAAWQRFMDLYREKLYAFALHLTHEASFARELADSLYADLFASRLTSASPGGSRFASYSGRGSLEGWLRAVLARQYTDHFRRRRLLVSYESEVEAGRDFSTDVAGSPSERGADPRLERALEAAMAKLNAEDRFLLACRYLDGKTLAEVARALRTHESTASRRLNRVLEGLRSAVKKQLKKDGCDNGTIQEMLEGAADRIEVDLRRHLETFGPERV